MSDDKIITQYLERTRGLIEFTEHERLKRGLWGHTGDIFKYLKHNSRDISLCDYTTLLKIYIERTPASLQYIPLVALLIIAMQNNRADQVEALLASGAEITLGVLNTSFTPAVAQVLLKHMLKMDATTFSTLIEYCTSDRRFLNVFKCLYDDTELGLHLSEFFRCVGVLPTDPSLPVEIIMHCARAGVCNKDTLPLVTFAIETSDKLIAVTARVSDLEKELDLVTRRLELTGGEFEATNTYVGSLTMKLRESNAELSAREKELIAVRAQLEYTTGVIAKLNNQLDS